jgi:glycosyltransferase involved in cell wall biosynthesis
MPGRSTPNSADVPAHDATGGEDARRLAQEMHGCFAVVFTGNIGQAQAMETIIGAAERLREQVGIRFYVVGSGSRAAWMATEIQRRKLGNLRLIGRLPATDMPVILSAASALLVTLKSDPVGAYTIPSKLQAYLGAGRPIIACMNGEGARIVDEAQAGLHCPAEDASALADAVLRLTSMSGDERLRLGQNGFRYFMNHYEATRLTNELIAHLEDCRLKTMGSKK